MIPYGDDGDFAVHYPTGDESSPLLHQIRTGEWIRADADGNTHELRDIRIRGSRVFASLVALYDTSDYIGSNIDYLIREAEHRGYKVRGFTTTSPVVADDLRPDCDKFGPTCGPKGDQ